MCRSVGQLTLEGAYPPDGEREIARSLGCNECVECKFGVGFWVVRCSLEIAIKRQVNLASIRMFTVRDEIKSAIRSDYKPDSGGMQVGFGLGARCRMVFDTVFFERFDLKSVYRVYKNSESKVAGSFHGAAQTSRTSTLLEKTSWNTREQKLSQVTSLKLASETSGLPIFVSEVKYRIAWGTGCEAVGGQLGTGAAKVNQLGAAHKAKSYDGPCVKLL